MDLEKKTDIPSAAVTHRLPTLPVMGRSMRTVQSKSSSKLRSESTGQQEDTVLHVDGTSKVIKISNGGISQLTEIKTKQTEESFAPSETCVLNENIFDNKIALTPNESPTLSETQTSKENKTAASVSDQGDDVRLLGPTEEAKGDGDENTMGQSRRLFETSYVQKRKMAIRENQSFGKKKSFPPTNTYGSKLKHAKEAVPAKIRKSTKSMETLQVLPKDFAVASTKNEADCVNIPTPNLPRQVLIFPGEIPTEEQIERMKAGETERSSLQHPIQLAEGDMRWGKVTGHPYWPCMVSNCPFSKLITRVKGDARSVRLYHVQFFGDECERGWIAEPSLIEFKGKQDFLEKARDSQKKTPKKGQSSYNPFNVKENRQDAWDAAVLEAQQAADLSVDERKVRYTFLYSFVDKSKNKKQTEKVKTLDSSEKSLVKASRGRKRKLSTKDNESTGQKSGKRQKLTIQPPKRPLLKTVPFQIYFATNSAAASEQHPEWDSETLRIFLRKQWKAERGAIDVPLETAVSPVTTPQNFSPASAKVPLRKGVPFQVYFNTHSTEARENHPEWNSEELRIFLRKQWKSERMIESDLPTSKTCLPIVKGEAIKCTGNKPVSQSQSPLVTSKKSLQARVLSKDGKDTRPGSPASSEGSEKQRCRPSRNPGMVTTSAEMETQTGIEGAANTTVLKRRRSNKTQAASNQEDVSSSSSLPDDVSDDVSEQEMSSLKAKSILARKSSQDSESSSESKGRREDESYELEIFKLMSTCKLDKDKVCSVCEKIGELVECSGHCGQHFHPSCVQFENKPEQTYTCPECVSGVHTCFSCKTTDSSTIKCSISVCGKYYHEACVKKHRLTRYEAKGLVCPMHTCATCAVDDIKNPKAFKGRFYRCIRCPKSYHVGDHCIPAGSMVIAGSNIICADHFAPNKAMSCHSRLNITWCFTCSKGGTLICCEACPAAYHAECVKMEKAPEEAWFCEECEAGRRPLYGTIVWIKIGNYRWWPGEICHPRNVPKNIQEKPHKVGEFPVRFFGSHDYYWIHRGRVFLFQEGDKASKESSAKGLFKTYVKGVEEATEALKIWTELKDKKDVQEQERKDKKPAPYKLIKSSVPVGNVQIYKADLSEIPVCECKPGKDDACASDCLNRMMLYECNPLTCPASEKCNNQRFQRRLYAEVEPFKCENRGWGLRCVQDVKKGQFVIEYVGDLIDEEECKKRIEQAHDDNITNFYMLTLDKNRIIDAGPKGNCSRFMNHSCDPNLVTQKWTVNGDIRVGLFALKDITKGSELTFNYNLECLGNEKKACACGADNCSGFLGVRPKANIPGAAKDKQAKEMKKKRKKKKLEQRKIYEDECFRCGVGGELVMCDVGNCPKVYHLHCLKLTKPPIGKWRCPWHHCDVCGKHAVNKCVECPDSFCLNHSDGNIFEKNGVQVCEDHLDLLESLMQPADKLNNTQDHDTHRNAEKVDSTLKETSGENLPLNGALGIISRTNTAPDPSPKQRVKRKYTKQCKSKLVDSGSNKCPILKITIAENKHSNSDSEIDNLGSKNKKGSGHDKPRSRSTSRNRNKQGENKLVTNITNGLHMPLSSPLNAVSNSKHRPLSNLQVKDSDDADSPSSLVIDLV